MKIVHCDWCGELIPQRPKGPEEDGEQIHVTRWVNGDPTTDDPDEYDLHTACADTLLGAIRDVMKNAPFKPMSASAKAHQS